MKPKGEHETRSRREGARQAGVKDHLLTWALVALTWLVCWLPAQLSYALADLGAWLLYRITLRQELRRQARGRGVLRNLTLAFRDELSSRQAREIMRRYCRHLTWLVVDFLRLPLLTPRRARRIYPPEVVAEVDRLLAQGRGLICVTGHIGSWEHLSAAIQLLGRKITAVARPVTPGIQGWLDYVRASSGQTVVKKWGSLWALKKALREDRLVGLVVDENVRDDGVFVPFFGVQAASNPAPYLLQRVSKAPLIVVTCHRVARGEYRVTLRRTIEYRRGEDRAAGLIRVTGEIVSAFEEAIRERPEQWLWGQRRWASRPEGEQPGPDGLPPRLAA